MVDRYSLVSISVNNFKSFEDVDVTFTSEEGITRRAMTIFGKLGSGKSTLIDAIQWCAYGTSSSKSSNLARRNIFPSHWNGDQKDDLSVLLRLRPEGDDDSRDNDIQCERLLSMDNARDILQVTVGQNTQTPQQSKEKFDQIFGIKPQLREGVMWILREQEMQRMAETIARDDSSYFLDFMNLRVPLNGLTEMNRTVQNKIEKLSIKLELIDGPDLLASETIKIKSKENVYNLRTFNIPFIAKYTHHRRMKAAAYLEQNKSQIFLASGYGEFFSIEKTNMNLKSLNLQRIKSFFFRYHIRR